MLLIAHLVFKTPASGPPREFGTQLQHEFIRLIAPGKERRCSKASDVNTGSINAQPPGVEGQIFPEHHEEPEIAS
ncbi:hypothetical protein T265_11333 [Opisthorchis viverrini]|uniref:Uncharacterized protein n=1 Tax=Opisthorchis viverrini TaxID=6198 RepID=A0A074Z9W1_OPIVI|nr:hypothetical protein T265_11333 [Opisthorchis viverrini]KER20030.1 hypothetical protein T265_11333 [Opisthorchis viverrini]